MTAWENKQHSNVDFFNTWNFRVKWECLYLNSTWNTILYRSSIPFSFTWNCTIARLYTYMYTQRNLGTKQYFEAGDQQAKQLNWLGSNMLTHELTIWLKCFKMKCKKILVHWCRFTLCRTTQMQKSFSPRTLYQNNIKCIKDIETFKEHLKEEKEDLDHLYICRIWKGTDSMVAVDPRARHMNAVWFGQRELPLSYSWSLCTSRLT